MMKGGKLSLIALMFLSLAVVLTGCGGGGGGSSSSSSSSTSTYTVGVAVTGLASGKFVVLQNNGGDDLTVTQDGSFTFATALADGASYNVTVKTQPVGQTCTASNNTGTISGADVTDVTVVCNDSGSLDTTFNKDGDVPGVAIYKGSNKSNDFGNSVTISNGKILVAGKIYNGSYDDMAVWRFNADGTPDTTFNTNGVATYNGGYNDYGNSITVDSNGKILVAGRIYNGSDYDMAVWRFNTDGTPDTGFGANGVVTYNGGYNDAGNSVTVDSNEKILVAGTIYIPFIGTSTGDDDMAVWRFNANGALDSTLDSDGIVSYDGGNGNDYGNSVTTVDSNGEILVAGYSYNGSDYDMAVWRLKDNGVLDTIYNSGIIGNDYGKSVTVDSNGNILVAGYINNGSNSDMVVFRFMANGVVDTTFGTNGVATSNGKYDEAGYSVTVDSNRNILVAGYSYNGSDYDMAVWRLMDNGVLDTTFGTNGVATYKSTFGNAGSSVTVDSNGKILVAGYINNGTDYDMAVWRFNP